MHKGVHKGVDLFVISSDLRTHVLDAWVKREAELLTDPPLPGQAWQTQTFCEGLLGTSGWALHQGGLQLSHPEELLSDSTEARDIDWKWIMFSASIIIIIALSCGCKVTGASCGGRPLTWWWTLEVRDAVELQKVCRSMMAGGKNSSLGGVQESQ